MESRASRFTSIVEGDLSIIRQVDGNFVVVKSTKLFRNTVKSSYVDPLIPIFIDPFNKLEINKLNGSVNSGFDGSLGLELTVYISKKWTANGNEVDVTIITKSALVECKNVSGSNFKSVEDNLRLIVEKYTKESKLSSSIKSLYPNHFGKMNVISSSNPFYNSSKSDFISKIKNSDVTNGQLSILGNGSNQLTLVDLKRVKELHIENAQGRFVIYSTDW